jgi:hypothetical protein
MIQRIQSVWLLLAAIAGILTYRWPLWEGILQDGTKKVFLGPEMLLLFTVIIATSVLALVTIFLFKNRKLQKTLCFLGIILSIGIVILEFTHVEGFKSETNFKESRWLFGSILPILMILLFMLAYGGIRKDQKLVKSLERLR